MGILKPSKKKIIKYKLYGFDIETYGKDNKFLMGSIVNEKERYIFWNKKDMQKFIMGSNKIRNSIIIATNLGFDFLGLFGNDFKILSKFSFILKGSDFISIKYISGKNNIVFYDTMNYLKTSVKKLGEIIGIPKLDKPKTLGKKVSRYSKEGQYLEEYNIRDSYITFKFMEFLQDNINKIGTSLMPTVASISMSLFKSKYLKDMLIQPKRKIMEEMFNGYYGGRVEAIYRGKITTDFFMYDINSLYPFVMQKYKYPHPNYLEFDKNPTLNNLKYEGLMKCRFICPKDLFIPLLPVRHDNKLIFPIGEHIGYYPHAELRKAIDLGYTIYPIKDYYYTKTFSPFYNFVNDLYKERMKYKKENNTVEYIFKICLNSLYGKMGQKLYMTDMYFINRKEDYKYITKCFNTNRLRNKKGLPERYDINWTATKRTINKDGSINETAMIYFIKDNESNKYPKFINPILALYTTSYARLELYSYIEKILNSGKTILYYDTDSLITDYKFNVSDKLGGLKLELPIKEGIIIKPKFYYVSDGNKEYIKAKGLRNLKNFADFEKLLETKKYSYIKFAKFKEALRRDMNFNEIFPVLKIINFDDNKRLWKHDFETTIKEKILDRSNPIDIKN